MGRAAKDMKLVLPSDAAVDAEVDLGTGDGGFFLQARLHISLPGLPADIAQAIIESAHQICPYSKMSRGNIDVSLSLVQA
jgi:organic hydroperoxide reductase OsmC/OhrA